MRQPRQAGFTLLELMVALFIAALMFAMGYAAINQGLTSHDSLKEQQAHLLQLQTTVRLLEQDFVQAAPRPVRQPVGDGAQSAMVGGTPGTQPVVALTRAGWSNPAGLQRPGLQRVAYFLENNTLRREYWDVLDPTLASVTAKRDLLEHVKSFTIRYLDQQRQWQDQWPPLTNTVQSGPTMEMSLRQRPLAVEITLDTEDWGKIVRVIEIAG
ncbi:MAG TPA: type II secretion system minor pseudopilin GspJ [Steroidobacteraceae bacterium]|nr:type II secretion system minor pseudopilin GspJ [Steroidobacteraceae bacterium]